MIMIQEQFWDPVSEIRGTNWYQDLYLDFKKHVITLYILY